MTHVQMAEDDIPMGQRVDSVLEQAGHMESRAAKMDIDDLLR